MRPIKLILALLLCASPAFAVPAIVSSNSNFGLTSAAVAFSPNTTAGNLIWVGCGNVGSTALTVADTQSHSFTSVQTQVPAGNRALDSWIVKNIAGGADTVTCSGGAFGVTIFIAEISGTSIPNSQPDVKTADVSTGTTLPQTSITNTVANEIFINMSWATNSNASITLSVDSSYNIIQNIHNSGGGIFTDASLAYLVVSSIAATTPTWTRTNSTGSTGWGAQNQGYSGAAAIGHGPKGKIL